VVGKYVSILLYFGFTLGLIYSTHGRVPFATADAKGTAMRRLPDGEFFGWVQVTNTSDLKGAHYSIQTEEVGIGNEHRGRRFLGRFIYPLTLKHVVSSCNTDCNMYIQRHPCRTQISCH